METRDDGGRVSVGEPEARLGPRCPVCRREVAWQGNPHRPFCSLVCRLVDLGVWLDEGYRIPGAEPAPEGPPERQD